MNKLGIFLDVIVGFAKKRFGCFAGMINAACAIPMVDRRHVQQGDGALLLHGLSWTTLANSWMPAKNKCLLHPRIVYRAVLLACRAAIPFFFSQGSLFTVPFSSFYSTPKKANGDQPKDSRHFPLHAFSPYLLVLLVRRLCSCPHGTCPLPLTIHCPSSPLHVPPCHSSFISNSVKHCALQRKQAAIGETTCSQPFSPSLLEPKEGHTST